MDLKARCRSSQKSLTKPPIRRSICRSLSSNSGADVIFLAAAPKPAIQAIRKMAELNWKPIRLLASISNSVGAVMKPAGMENAKGILSAGYLKDPSSPLWKDDPAVKEWEVFMAAYYLDGDRTNTFTAYSRRTNDGPGS